MHLSLALPSTDLRDEIRQRYLQARANTLSLFENLDSTCFYRQAHPDFSPMGWHLGHIGFTEGLWLLEQGAGQKPLFPDYRQLFAADGLPKAQRQQLPSFPEVCDYLGDIRRQVFEYLAHAPLEEQGWLWLWLIQHESQHCETITWVFHLHQRQVSRQTYIAIQPTRPQQEPTMREKFSAPVSLAETIRIEGGLFRCGNDDIEALDNEKPEHLVSLETYWIDPTPVTCGDYAQFIDAGGYTERRWWADAGWAWLQDNPVTHPRYWNLAGMENHPVCGVSWFEADAYARFVGKRLPTEAEWEKAASWHPELATRQVYPWGAEAPNHQRCNFGGRQGQTTPVTQYPQGQSAYGCYDMLGNVWEWTDTWFHPYEGYVSFPYEGYSKAYFDNQHRVLKGGSWAVQAPVLRCAFRNWYYPATREHFAGFRCAYS
ncbi:MAG: SUMF1/EgtB/PvdO family nonheme iron enzyme [Cyanobacteria bacterium P01_A01_bin.17]